MWPKCLKNIKISSRALKLDMYWMELNHTYNEPRLKSTKKSPQIGSFTSVAYALVTDVSDEWWKIEIARFFVPPFVKILISHSWIMRQLDSWRRIISSSIGHLSFIIKWKVTKHSHQTFVKKITTSQILFLAKYFYCYTGATRTTKSNSNLSSWFELRGFQSFIAADC